MVQGCQDTQVGRRIFLIRTKVRYGNSLSVSSVYHLEGIQ